AQARVAPAPGRRSRHTTRPEYVGGLDGRSRLGWTAAVRRAGELSDGHEDRGERRPAGAESDGSFPRREPLLLELADLGARNGYERAGAEVLRLRFRKETPSRDDERVRVGVGDPPLHQRDPVDRDLPDPGVKRRTR